MGENTRKPELRWKGRSRCILTTPGPSTTSPLGNAAGRDTEAKVTDLQKVVAAVCLLAGRRTRARISYYQQHHSERAMEQFKALQAIDPDDLPAHYNLRFSIAGWD